MLRCRCVTVLARAAATGAHRPPPPSLRAAGGGSNSAAPPPGLGWRQLSPDAAADWSGPSEAECAVLRRRRVVVDVCHQPTAEQVSACALCRAM